MQKTHVNTRHAQDFAPDNKTISTFLATQLQRDWFHLYANSPDADRRSMIGHVAENIEDALDWIDRQQSKGRNIYFALNTPKRTQAKKAGKDELRELWGYHIDWDLPKDVERDSREAEDLIDDAIDRLANDAKLPGNPCIVFSGNGVQAYWFFAKPERATDANQGELETINKRLAQHFKAPAGTHNSERILRVPGTWNFPNEAKRKRGCAPVLAELCERASRDFEPGDFKGLPKVDPVTIRATAKRQDFTKAAWIDWQPYDWRDLLKAMPDLPGRLQETLDGQGEYDRSRALYRLIHACLDFLVIEDGQRTVEEMLDDRDIKKQIAELCWDAAATNSVCAEIMDHIVDHEYGPAQLGYDITRVMNAAADEGKAPTPRLVNRVHAQAEVFHINTADEDDVSPEAAEVAFSQWFRNHVKREDLPEVEMQAEQSAKRQFATLVNIRAALRMASIEARWDAMRNEPRFFVDPEAGLKGARQERPAFNWERALSRTAANARARHEMQLILGALTGIGIVDKTNAEDTLAIISRDSPFHPVEAYATARPWDGVDRIAQAAHCLTTKHPLARRYLEVHFYQQIGAVKSLRNYHATERGIQLDSTVVLCGGQDIGKSTFWEKLTPGIFLSPGSSLKLGTMREADSMRDCLSGLVCILNEIGQTLDRSDANALKDFQTATLDTYRTAWARHPLSKPRMTVLCGTANQDFQLRDQTGSRRYLCMKVDAIDWAGVNALARPDELQQLYAQAWEAVMEDGAGWRLTDEERDIRDRENEAHREIPEEEGRLNDYMASIGKAHVQAWLSANQICKLLDIRYTSSRMHILRAGLEAHECEYRAKVKGYRRVYDFPVLPERLDELRTIGR